MKGEIGSLIKKAASFEKAYAIVDDWIDYYNTDLYHWDLAKLSPNEFYNYCITGVYPLTFWTPTAPDKVTDKKE